MPKTKKPVKRRSRSRPLPAESGFLQALAGTLGRINDHLATRRGAVKSVMIIEDDDDGRDILATVLGHAGYATVCVSNGKDALTKLKKVIPSLIILDLQMPGMDGWTVDRSLKADPTLRRIPVVVTSAFANLASARMGVGAEAYFQKPIDLEALLETLPRLLKNSSMKSPARKKKAGRSS